MKYILTSLCLLTILFIQACSSGQQLAQKSDQVSNEPAPNRPSWFSNEGVRADSSGFTSVSITLSGDSLNALQTAEKKARMDLEVYAGDMIEEMRLSAVIDGEQSLDAEGFIFKLRQASQLLEEEAQVLQTSVIKESGGYLGFASVKISREQAKQLVQGAMAGYTDELKILFAAGDYFNL